MSLQQQQTHQMPRSWLKIPCPRKGSEAPWRSGSFGARGKGKQGGKQGCTRGISLGRRNQSREPPPCLPPGQIWDNFGIKRIKTELIIHEVSTKAELLAILKREQRTPVFEEEGQPGNSTRQCAPPGLLTCRTGRSPQWT